jgi:hypothetical protein
MRDFIVLFFTSISSKICTQKLTDLIQYLFVVFLFLNVSNCLVFSLGVLLFSVF